MNMLTYAQFKNKHAQKYSGLSKADIRMRYDDYLSSKSTKGQKQGSSASKARVTGLPVVNVPHLSPCAVLYNRALTNPFGGFEHLPCIPDTLSVPSIKFSTMARGTLAIGTAGVGYIFLRPFCVANDEACGAYTTSTFTLDHFTSVPEPLTEGEPSFFNDSPYSTADLAGNDARVVGAGIRVSYMGTELNRGGVVILHRQPSGNNVPELSNDVSLLKNRPTVQGIATRDSESVNYRPDNPDQFGYSDATIAGPHSLLIYISGAVPGTTWAFEIIQFYEMVGTRGNPTMSHSDPVGMGAVIGSTPVVNSILPPKAQERISLDDATKAVAYSSSGIISASKAMIATAASSVLGEVGNALAGPAGGYIGQAMGNMIAAGKTEPSPGRQLAIEGRTVGMDFFRQRERSFFG